MLFKKILDRSKRSKTRVLGFVEKLSNSSIEGWAIHREHQSIELSLVINNESYKLEPEWIHRNDVRDIHGTEFEPSGFICTLPENIAAKIEQLAEQDQISIQGSGVALKILCDVSLDSLRLGEAQPDSSSETALLSEQAFNPAVAYSDILDENDQVVGEISTFEKCIVSGWLDKDFYNDSKPLSIKINDNPIEFSDLAELVLIDGENNFSFQIHLPGYIWGGRDEKIFTLSFVAGEHRLKTKDIVLEENLLITWCNEITDLPEGKHKQYLALLLLEHIHYANIYPQLSEKSQQYYALFAEKMRLRDMITYDSGVEPDDKHAVDLNTKSLWNALRHFNALLLEDDTNSINYVTEIAQKRSLKDGYLHDFILSITPYFARRNELQNLRALVNFSEFYKYSYSQNNWYSSTSIAFLTADGKLKRATDTLWKITNNLKTGWLSTESLYFSVKFTFESHALTGIDRKEWEDFFYAFLALLDNFHGDWFSRLHDKMLQLCMVEMIRQRVLMSDYLQKRVIASAIRHYGMSPDFWELTELHTIDLEGTLLERAHHHWSQIYQRFANPENIATDTHKVFKSAQFFLQRNNPEALEIIRELLLACFSVNKQLEPEEFIGDIEELTNQKSMEMIRFAASPSIDEALRTKLITLHRPGIFDLLRTNTARATSNNHFAQNAIITKIRIAVENHDASIVPSMLDKIVLLSNWQSMFLSCDIIATFLAKGLIENEMGLMHLENAIVPVIDQCDDKFFLPAPVCNALTSLGRLENNPMITGWLKGITTKIQNKFKKKHSFIDVDPTLDCITEPGWPTDTLVIIYSCQPYLDTRVKAIRETWAKDLSKRNIPYLFLVGDGDDRIHDDVLKLDVSDAYEDLPQKTLKMFEWLCNNTCAQYIIKIDDDCYMDVDNYFDSPSYRKHHYYGRVIKRPVGGMDRTWHQSKSKTLNARKAIDKSPEPSIYADGGGGYSLSRQAAYELLKNSNTLEGKRLIASSFMEDKLVGDLLSLSYIEPSNEDYECYQRRRTTADAIPVGMYENTFYPSSITPTKVVHLDTEKDQILAEKTRDTQELRPYKIWPTYCDVAFDGSSTNQLELLTETNRFKQLLDNEFYVVAVMRNEMVILDHFLNHYRSMGVKTFIVADNCSDDGTREFLNEQPDVILYSVSTQYKQSHYGVSWQQAILANHCIGKWVLVADADEFLVCPDGTKNQLSTFIEEAEAQEADCVRIEMIDMYPYGDLSEADFNKNSPFEVAPWHDEEPLTEWRLGSGYYSNRPSFVSSLRHRIDKNAEPNAFTSQKYALFKYRPWIRLSQGIHDIAGVRVYSSKKAWFAHFKYHAGFKDKVMEEIQRKQHYDGAKEYKRYASMLAEAGGQFGIDNISVEFKS